MSNNNRLAYRLAFLIIAVTAACGDNIPGAEPQPDASIAIPIDPTGRFALRSTFAVGAPPGVVAGVLGELHAATDSPDDPSRYLVDLVIARLPEGHARTFAYAIAPYIAAYVNARIATVAPRFIEGIRALAVGYGRVAQRFGTIEELRVAADGVARHTIVGLHFDGVDVAFEPLGLRDVTTDTRVTLVGERFEIQAHESAIAYGQLLRLGFDRAVIPSIVPAASDLARALRELVDCTRLGQLIAERVGLGSPSLYAQACTLGLTVAANKIYEQFPAFDAPPLSLELSGTARAIDRNGDGPMDAIEGGSWTGRFDGAALGVATFEGTRP